MVSDKLQLADFLTKNTICLATICLAAICLYRVVLIAANKGGEESVNICKFQMSV